MLKDQKQKKKFFFLTKGFLFVFQCPVKIQDRYFV